MKKILSCAVMLAFVCGASATVYYADPASTNKNATGGSWEQAVTIANLTKVMNRLSEGDTIYVKGGTITLAAAGDSWNIKKGIAIIGGFDPQATGTVTQLPTYPSATPTILSGDVNGNGKADSGDAPSLIFIDLQSANTQKVTIQGIDLVNSYYDNVEEASDDLKTYLSKAAALRVICGTAFIKNCHFYNHITPINRGSQCVTVVGANVHMTDCEMHDCICLSRGALVRTRDYFINGVESDPIHPSLVLERCALYNANNMGGDKLNATGVYGGAVHASTGEFFAINSTFVCDSTYSKGGAVRSANGVRFISCTIGNNYSARVVDGTADKKNSYGSSIGLDNDAEFRFANTFMVDDADNGTKQFTPFYSDNNHKTMDELGKSGGYNIMGTIFFVKDEVRVKDMSEFMQATDLYSEDATTQIFYPYFGSMSNLQDNGGCSKTILPLNMQKGDNVAHLQELADDWCPDWTKVDASVDQRGFKRDSAETCVGAAAYEAAIPEGINEIRAAYRNDPTLYNIFGLPVSEDYKGLVIRKGQKYMLQ